MTEGTIPESGSGSLTITDDGGTSTLDVRIDGDTDIPGANTPTQAFDLIGISSQFDSWVPLNWGYQIVPRERDDILSDEVNHPVLLISEIHADPAGDLTGDANGDGVRDAYDDEFIEIVNTGFEEINISGYTLSDAGGLRHTFEPGTIIPPREAAVVFGGGTPTGDFGSAAANGLVFVASTSTNESGYSNEDSATPQGSGAPAPFKATSWERLLVLGLGGRRCEYPGAQAGGLDEEFGTMSLEPGGPPIRTTPSPFITRVRLREYKSIASCDVAPGAFSVLVGPNGSGKSNFLDALALLSDALNGSLERALQARGGSQAVHRQPRHSEEPIRVAVEFHPTAESSGQFELVLETESGGGFRVLREVCSLKPNGSSPGAPEYRYRVEGGRVIEWPANDPPVASADSLYLVRVSGVPEFRPAFDALSRIRICSFDPSRIPPVTPPRSSDHLAADASNLPSVIRRLQAESPEIREDIEVYLRSVLPSLRSVEAVAVGSFETLEFVLQSGTDIHRFPPSNISNGTLRALALLVAVLQPASNHGGKATLIGIEEPEKAIHPAAIAALGDAFLDASQATQVLVSTHSPDFLDNEAITSRNVIAVGIRDGVTHLGELDDFGQSVLRDGLFTLSELMRQNHLRPRLPASSVEPQLVGAVPRHD